VYGHLATAHKIKHAITSRIEGGVGNVRDERRWRSAAEHPRLSVPALFPFFYFKNKKWGKEKKWEDLVHSMTDDNNDDGDDGNFDDTLSEILGTSSRVATSPDLGLALSMTLLEYTNLNI